MCVIVAAGQADAVASALKDAGETVVRLGAVVPRRDEGDAVQLQGLEQAWPS